jgi:hypothetical protein
MWKLYDFECQECGCIFEKRVSNEKPMPTACPECTATEFKRLPSAPAILSTIVPAYPGSKKFRAGYQHTHNRPAEKAATQVSMYSGKKTD